MGGSADASLIVSHTGYSSEQTLTGGGSGSGGSGNDVLNGTGDDGYTLGGGGGNDLVGASVSYVADAGIERVKLTGNAAIPATGNAEANRLDGNGAANVLTGLGGNDTLTGNGGDDTMAGGAGDDLYWVADAGGVGDETGGDGSDRVIATVSYALQSGIERLTLLGTAGLTGTGNAGSNHLEGNDGNNLLTGLDGNDRLMGLGGADTLVGGLGRDVMVGGAGADHFRFAAPGEAPAGTGRDVISDFDGAGGDVIDLATMDAVTATADNEAFMWIGNAAFAGVAGELRYAGGMLAGDVNGDRVADFEIQLNGAPILDPNLHLLL